MAYHSTPESKHIAGFDYSNTNNTLTITFKRGLHQYMYYDVPETIIDGFRTSISKSAYFVKFIKPIYRCIKVK